MNARKILPALLAVVVVVVAFLLLRGGDDAYTVKAELPNAGGVKVNSSVKIAGVTGGTVKKIELTPRDTAMLTLELEDTAAPIGAGASIEVRPTDLLGERYIALDPGDQAKPQRDGDAFVPKNRATLPVELDEVINTFDGDTRERIKILVNEFGVALGGRGKDLAKLLDAMPPSLQDARKLISEITSENASLKALLARGDSLTASVEPRKDQLASLIEQADASLGALADRREKIGRALDTAPGGLSALNTTLAQLRTASTNLRPAAADLRAAAGPLKSTLDAVPGFEDSARDSLRAAKEVAPSITKLGKKATGPLQALTPTLANLQGFSGDLKPTLDAFDARAFEDLMWMTQNFGGMAMKHRDSLGHQLGAMISVNPETFITVYNSLFNNPADASRDPDNVNAADTTRQRTRTKPAASGDAPSTSTTPGPASPAAPATSAAPTPSAPAASEPRKGLLEGLVDGVSGLLGGNAGSSSKSGSGQSGVPGLLNNLLAP